MNIKKSIILKDNDDIHNKYYYKYLKYKSKYIDLVNKYPKYYQYGGQNVNHTENDNNTIDAEEIDMGDANNNMTINIFENLDGASNLFSPLSISYTLSLMHLGAMGKTDTQIKKLLGYKYDIDDLKSLYEQFNNNVMKMTSALLINKNYKINDEYIEIITPLTLIAYDSFQNARLIASKINKYIEKNTDAMIKDVISATDLSTDTIMVLINTIYFKASWKNKFNINNTTKMKFHRTENNMIDMMHQINTFNYFENNDIQMVELPYDEEDYVMGIILPKKFMEGDNLDYSVNNVPILSEPEINEIINNGEYKLVDLYLPKYTQRKKLDMVNLLKKMGVISLFNKEAQLDIISKELYVSKIIHEAVVIVDEIGTEASATSVVISKQMSINNTQQPILFMADHAYIYYIRHIPSRMFLFFGDYQGN